MTNLQADERYRPEDNPQRRYLTIDKRERSQSLVPLSEDLARACPKGGNARLLLATVEMRVTPAATKNDRGDIIPCHFHLSCYMQVYPPSTGRATPVTYDDLGEARNTAAVSSSPSLPYLSIGIIVLAFAWKKSLSRVSLVRSV